MNAKATITGVATQLQPSSPGAPSALRFGSFEIDIADAITQLLRAPLRVEAELREDGRWHATRIVPETPSSTVDDAWPAPRPVSSPSATSTASRTLSVVPVSTATTGGAIRAASTPSPSRSGPFAARAPGSVGPTPKSPPFPAARPAPPAPPAAPARQAPVRFDPSADLDKDIPF